MKKKFGLAFATLSLAAVMCFGTACGGNDPGTNGPGGDDEGDPTPETTYTVRFTDRGKEVASYTKKKGEKITVPATPEREDNRYRFDGWEGLAEDATEITVYGDAVYDANWYERFGSETVFTAMERNSAKNIVFDGAGTDEAWADAEAYPLDGNGSSVKFLWDEDGVYLFADVKKENASQTTDHLNILIDLLHGEELASDTWDGKSWGGVYRGEPGPMVEGGYTVKAGAASDEDIDKTWEWLSAGDSDRAIGSVVSDGGYTVEFKIGTTNSSIGEYKPHEGQEIGLSVKSNDGAALESFEGYADHGPKSLSNVLLVKNPENVEFLWRVREVRENYDIVVDGKEDRLLYERDASVFEVGDDGTTVKALWHQSGKMYLLATLGDTTTSLKVEAFGGSVEFTESGEKALVASGEYAGAFEVDDWGAFTLTVNGTPTESHIRLIRNDSNIGHNLFEAKKLAEGAEITVDGILDAAYGEKVADVNTVSLREAGAPQATGKAYIRWDDEYLYVFVDVTDGDVSTEKRGDPHNNDSVEVWLDTCQMFPTASTGWGDNNRPVGLYRGEGGYRVVAGKVGDDSGSHWLWDDARTRPETASVVTETGYTVEYKIPWGKKLDEWDDGFANYIPSTDAHIGDEHYTKVGQIVNIMININDDNGQDGVREGITSLNGKGCEAWHQPYVLDQLKLVAAD